MARTRFFDVPMTAHCRRATVGGLPLQKVPGFIVRLTELAVVSGGWQFRLYCILQTVFARDRDDDPGSRDGFESLFVVNGERIGVRLKSHMYQLDVWIEHL